MAEKMGPIIATNGLVFCVDAANPQSIVSGQTVWKDLTFNTTGGTLVNGVGFSGSGVSSGLVFDGTDDYVNISSDQPFTPRTGLTIESWSNATDITTNRYYEIARRQGGGGLPTYLLSYQEYGNVMSFGLKTNVTYDELDIVINSGGTNSWLSYVATWDGTKKRLYRNGSNIGQNNQSGTIDDASGAVTNIGRLPIFTGEYFKGRIAYVSNYNRGLSPFEVYQNFNALKGRYGIPDIVTAGLILNLDAGNPYSYNPDNTGSTVWTDVTYNTTGGTLVNGTYYTGGTMVFDGVDDYVNCGTQIDLSQYSAFSVDIWVNPKSLTGFKSAFAFANNPSGTGWQHWIGTNGNNFYAEMRSGGSDRALSASGAVLNTWSHITTVWNGTTLFLYINGVERTSIAASAITNTVKTLYIGYFPGFTVWDGFVSNTKIYNRALTQAEIIQNFNALRGRYGI